MFDQQNKDADPEDKVEGKRQVGVNDLGRAFPFTLGIGKEQVAEDAENDERHRVKQLGGVELQLHIGRQGIHDIGYQRRGRGDADHLVQQADIVALQRFTGHLFGMDRFNFKQFLPALDQGQEYGQKKCADQDPGEEDDMIDRAPDQQAQDETQCHNHDIDNDHAF